MCLKLKLWLLRSAKFKSHYGCLNDSHERSLFSGLQARLGANAAGYLHNKNIMVQKNKEEIGVGKERLRIFSPIDSERGSETSYWLLNRMALCCRNIDASHNLLLSYRIKSDFTAHMSAMVIWHSGRTT